MNQNNPESQPSRFEVTVGNHPAQLELFLATMAANGWDAKEVLPPTSISYEKLIETLSALAADNNLPRFSNAKGLLVQCNWWETADGCLREEVMGTFLKEEVLGAFKVLNYENFLAFIRAKNLDLPGGLKRATFLALQKAINKIVTG